MSSCRLNILFLGGAKRVSMARALIEAGGRRGYDVDIFSHELSQFEPIASIGTVITGSRYNSPDILTELEGIIHEKNIDIVLPFIDPSIGIAREVADRCGIFSPTTSTALAARLFDKVASAKLFEECGLPIPTTYATVDSIVYPAILKPRRGSASKGIVIARNASDTKQIVDFDDYLIQQYIDHDTEYTLDCYVGMYDGAAKCIVPRQRLVTTGGEVSKTRTCRNNELIALGTQVIKALGLRGAVTLQFLHDRNTGRLLLMEINPRLGGGVICSLQAGADIAGMIIDEATGKDATLCETWKDKTLMTRYMQEVIFYE